MHLGSVSEAPNTSRNGLLVVWGDREKWPSVCVTGFHMLEIPDSIVKEQILSHRQSKRIILNFHTWTLSLAYQACNARQWSWTGLSVIQAHGSSHNRTAKYSNCLTSLVGAERCTLRSSHFQRDCDYTEWLRFQTESILLDLLCSQSRSCSAWLIQVINTPPWSPWSQLSIGTLDGLLRGLWNKLAAVGTSPLLQDESSPRLALEKLP